MRQVERIEEFYKTIPKNVCVNYPSNGIGKGHFNVFARWRCKGTFIRRDFYKIVLVIGTGILKYAHQEIMIDKPALFFTTPLVPYSWKPVSENQEGWLCLFTEEFLQKDKTVMEYNYSVLKIDRPVFFLKEEDLSIISALFQKMMEEISSDYIYKYDVLYNYLKLLIHQAQKLDPETESKHRHMNASQRLVYMFFEILERQFPIDSPEMPLLMKTPQDFSEKLSVHVNHLNHTVKELTGKTSSQIISDRIIQDAKALLKNTDWNISDIAYALGFEYPSHFTNFFSKKTGESPKNFRIF
ncbi:MAG: helix-turn-helix transcriptional regulator [Flavobacteriaceae bacterium]|jgi:AraC-like DNA-binding protein|nr:helix-turn-helix transcriptional regulator [Flavobacteriaceae bacterium]